MTYYCWCNLIHIYSIGFFGFPATFRFFSEILPDFSFISLQCPLVFVISLNSLRCSPTRRGKGYIWPHILLKHHTERQKNDELTIYSAQLEHTIA